MMSPSTRRQRHPRPIKQCSECRRRKKKCDGYGARDGGACGPCRERGVSNRCHWGGDLASSPPSHPVQFDEPPRTRPHPESVALINELTQADTFSPARNQEERRSAPKHSFPSRSQALNLAQIYEDQLCFGGLHVIDFDAVRRGAEELPKIEQNDLLALVLLLAASTLDLLPSSYAISLGLVTRSEEIEALVRHWTDEGLSALMACDLYLQPTILAVQALVVYQYNLVEHGESFRMVQTIDLAIRAARKLGLDRLRSMEEDEALWAQQDEQQPAPTLAYHSCGEWAVETLRSRDRRARELGRSQWWMLTSRDWAGTRQHGSYSIHPNSFDTQPPQLVINGSQDPWDYLVQASDVARRFSDLCAQAATSTLTGHLSYADVLAFDAEVQQLLERRPPWLRPEEEQSRPNGGAQTFIVDAFGRRKESPFLPILLSCTLWHRLFVIHRPFLALSISDPSQYGLSDTRTWDVAILFLDVTRRGVDKGMLLINQAVFLYRTQQAALVLITHLLLGAVAQCTPRPSLAERIQIHGLITFAIMTLKRRGAGNKLEALVASCSPWMNEQVIPSYTLPHPPSSSIPPSSSLLSPTSSADLPHGAHHQHHHHHQQQQQQQRDQAPPPPPTVADITNLFDLDTQLFRLDNSAPDDGGEIWHHLDGIFRGGNASS